MSLELSLENRGSTAMQSIISIVVVRVIIKRKMNFLSALALATAIVTALATNVSAQGEDCEGKLNMRYF